MNAIIVIKDGAVLATFIATYLDTAKEEYQRWKDNHKELLSIKGAFTSIFTEVKPIERIT
jgi:hypothetical protein